MICGFDVIWSAVPVKSRARLLHPVSAPTRYDRCLLMAILALCPVAGVGIFR